MIDGRPERAQHVEQAEGRREELVPGPREVRLAWSEAARVVGVADDSADSTPINITTNNTGLIPFTSMSMTPCMV